MGRVRRNVDTISPKLTFKYENELNPTFSELLEFINGKEFPCYNKEFEFKLLSSELNGCQVGIIETMLTKGLPPKKNRKTKQMSKLGIDPNIERLAYGNIFLYDKERNILLFEINKNGCFPDRFIEILQKIWNKEHENDEIRFDLKFLPILRKDAYERALRLDYYKEIFVEIYNPLELINEFIEERDSIANSVIKTNLDAAAKNNAKSLILVQNAKTKKLNPMGLSRSHSKDWIESIRQIKHKNITSFEVKGYLTDPEDYDPSSGRKLRKVNMMADTFDVYFYLDEPTIQTDIQDKQRKDAIEKLYTDCLPEFIEILGN